VSISDRLLHETAKLQSSSRAIQASWISDSKNPIRLECEGKTSKAWPLEAVNSLLD